MRSFALAALVALGVALAACGTARPNKLLGTRSRLAALKAPHEAIYVKTYRGVVRVFLDTGDFELVAGRHAVVIDEHTSLAKRRGRFVVRRGEVEREVPDLVATDESPVLSPDRARFVVAQDDDVKADESVELAVVELADLSVRRFRVASKAFGFVWSPDGSELRFDLYNQRAGSEHHRLVLDTGAIDMIERAATDQQRKVQNTEHTCPARKHQLVTDRSGDTQRIQIVPLPDPANPDRLSTATPRVLVEATNRSWHPHSGGPIPDHLANPIFTASCDHFVFEMGERIYVGDVVTGHYAFLATGTDPTRRLPD